MDFDPRGEDPRFFLKVRHLCDAVGDVPRGGGYVEEVATNTGRLPSCLLPAIQTLPNADVLFSFINGIPIRGIRSLADGRVPITSLVDVPPQSTVLVWAHDGQKSDIQAIKTLPLGESDK
jgi:hypothetical protein